MPHKVILALLAVGSFAVGTDGFVISGILSRIAGELEVSEPVAGQLVTAFALSYAISAPVLMTLTAGLSRRVMLRGSLLIFLLANVLGAIAPTYGVLMAARILAGVGAALYMNTAAAAATALAGERYRGRAVSLIIGGLTVATALGVPGGTLVGQLGGWRATLVLVAVLALPVLISLFFVLPAVPQPPLISLRDRVRIGAQRPVLLAILANLFAVAGCFTVFTYLAVFTRTATGMDDASVSVVLLVWGVAGAVGNAIGGRLSDRIGAERTFTASVSGVVVTMTLLAVMASFFASGSTLVVAVFLAVTVAWGTVYWAEPPTAIHRVLDLAPTAPSVAISVNSSASYLGVALGGAVGGAVLDRLSAAAVAWAGVCLELIALACVVLPRVSAGRRSRVHVPGHASPEPVREV
ncbi:MFS transporter [Streptomyces sp. 7N604]|uniref:MFS transporter n=1 Tax=Streptomyces sp. 7N604 TaxID=3457415 RepID=UPI003FD0A49D